MIKLIPALILIFFSSATYSQAISKRTVDSSGHIIVFTTIDTIVANTDAYCAVDGLIYSADSINYYALDFYFTSPQSFLLSSKDKVYIRYSDGEVYEVSPFSEGNYYAKGQEVYISITVSENALYKMLQYPVKSISLVTQKFRHNIPVDSNYEKTFENLADFMLNLNVYDENGIKWSELTKMKFPEN